VRPSHRSVTPSYHLATANWWQHQNLYVGPAGMNYLPHFVVLYTPFHFLPRPLGEVLWRFLSALTLGGGLWQLVRALFAAEPDRPFFWASLLAMPLCMNSLRNGNANAIFGGVVLLAIVALVCQRWWLAVGLIALATALKPLGVVLLLLAPLVYAPVRWRVPAAIIALAIFPFLFGPPSYVAGQYREAWNNLQACAVVSEHRFADINGILRTFDVQLGPQFSKLLRVAAGALFAALFYWGAKRIREPLSYLWLYALATGYLMLFNPMTEENSYGILAPALGIWSAFFLFSVKAPPGRTLAFVIAAMALSMGLLPNLVRPLFGNHFALFWHPVMAILFLSILAWFIARSPAAQNELIAQPA
jgi:alpha-1,2-mannosyltransferase